MRRTALMVLSVLFCASLYASAPSSVYIRGGHLFSYDTNVYSEPMVRNAGADWLEWRAENPFIKRYNKGILADADIFFSERAGLSISLADGVAFRESRFIPVKDGDDWESWDYIEQDALSESQRKLFPAAGPVFRAVIGPLDLALAVRASFGSFDFFKNSIILGLQAELYGNLFISENLFITCGMLYDAHLMEFYLKNDSVWYNENYTMLTAGCYVGVGYKIGRRGK